MAHKKYTRLDKQLDFIRTLDKLKSVSRRTYLLDSSRTENSAEHSWQIALMGLLLAEYAAGAVDLLKVVKLLLIHDIVEIEAGDTYIYDERASAKQGARERAAARKLFGLLPADQKREFQNLWRSYEKGESREARFARAVDRLQPLYHNFLTQGKAWREHGVRAAQVRKVNRKVAEGSSALGDFTESLIRESVSRGYLSE